MANLREFRIRIKSVKNISTVTRAMQAVSASKVRKATAAMMNTRPYATMAWEVLKHIAGQPGREALHPLLTTRPEVRKVLAVMITGDRGLAGGYTANIVGFTARHFRDYPVPVSYIAVGRKGRDLLYRMQKDVLAEFSGLPANPSFADTSAIGRVAVDEFLSGKVDEVYLLYTRFISMSRQVPVMKKLLPLEVSEEGEGRVVEFGASKRETAASYIYEPDQSAILDEILPRFTALQVFQAIMEAQASEHAARMLAMKNATESANALVDALNLEYNKLRQQTITSEMLDIAGGAEALEQG